MSGFMSWFTLSEENDWAPEPKWNAPADTKSAAASGWGATKNMGARVPTPSERKKNTFENRDRKAIKKNKKNKNRGGGLMKAVMDSPMAEDEPSPYIFKSNNPFAVLGTSIEDDEADEAAEAAVAAAAAKAKAAEDAAHAKAAAAAAKKAAAEEARAKAAAAKAAKKATKDAEPAIKVQREPAAKKAPLTPVARRTRGGVMAKMSEVMEKVVAAVSPMIERSMSRTNVVESATAMITDIFSPAKPAAKKPKAVAEKPKAAKPAPAVVEAPTRRSTRLRAA